MLLGIRQANIVEYVAAAALKFDLLLHSWSPRSIASASRSRCSIKRLSKAGISRPVFDFF
jgi:hypothetical protein